MKTTSTSSYLDYCTDSLLGTEYSYNLSNLLLSKEDKETLITDILESEDELMPIIKKYLVGYLDKIMENPDPIIDKLIKEKDTEIKELKDRVNQLEKQVSILKNYTPIPLGIQPNPIDPIQPNPYIPWGSNDICYCSDNNSFIANSVNKISSTTTVSTSV
jgi:hypothetical protein